MKIDIEALSKGRNCDYLEIRLEDSQRTDIQFSGRDIDKSLIKREFGGNVRACHKGGWSFVSFNSLDGIEKSVEQAVKQAREIGSMVSGKTQLAPVDPVKDVVRINPVADVRDITLEKKMDTLLAYNDLILSIHDSIKSSSIAYRDAFTTLQFASSEGTSIIQEKMDMGCNLTAIATGDGKTKYGPVSVGSSNDWSKLLGLEDKLREKGKLAVELLSAPLPKSNKYTVILGAKLAGTFIHEAFGHLSEGDNVYENPELASVMTMGRTFGKPLLNVYDTGLDVGVRGFLKYDDEGVPTEKTWLIREGKLSGRLHSRETAGKMGERATGSARAINYQHPPIPRMRNTCIQKGDTTPEDMIANIKNGIICEGVFGGQTNGEMFTFKSAYAYMIENGKKTRLMSGPMLQGNVFETLGNISAVGTDYIDPDSAGGCGKGGQGPLPTTHGSPSVRIDDVVVSGD